MIAVAWGAVIALTCVVGGGLWWWLSREREIIAPLPIGLGTIALYVVPRAVYLLVFGRAPLTSAGLTQAQQVALISSTTLAALVAALGMLLGHRARWAIRSGTRLRLEVPAPDRNRGLWVGGVAALVGLLVLGYLFTIVGNLAYALGHQDEVTVLLERQQSLFQVARLVVVAVLVLLVDPVSRKSRWWVWLMALVSTLAFLPFGSRALVLLAAASPIALYHLTVRQVQLRWMLLGTAVAAAGLFGLGFARLLTSQRIEQTAAAFSKHPLTAVHFAFNAVGELKIFDATSIVIRDVPEFTPYNYGETFARVPWMIIPRRLWHEKPVTSGHLIVRRYLPNLRTAYPPMAIGELFAAAGWFGVLIGFFLLGWVSRVVWEWHQRHAGSGNASVYLLYCFFVFDFIRVGDPSRTTWFLLIGASLTALVFAVSASYSVPPDADRLASSSPSRAPA